MVDNGIGCFNGKADELMSAAKRETWSDTNLDRIHPNTEFVKLECNNCKHTVFEIASTGSYETCARCVNCYRWFIVHSG